MTDSTDNDYNKCYKSLFGEDEDIFAQDDQNQPPQIPLRNPDGNDDDYESGSSVGSDELNNNNNNNKFSTVKNNRPPPPSAVAADASSSSPSRPVPKEATIDHKEDQILSSPQTKEQQDENKRRLDEALKDIEDQSVRLLADMDDISISSQLKPCRNILDAPRHLRDVNENKCRDVCSRCCNYIPIACGKVFNKENLSSPSFVFGLLFDLFQIILSCSDIATDILVAREFYLEGHKTFFGLMCATLTITSIANAIGFLIRMGAFRNEEDICSIFLVFPFSIVGVLLPVVNYVASKFDCLPSNARGNYVADADWDNLQNELAEDEMDDDEKKKKKMNKATSTNSNKYQPLGDSSINIDINNDDEPPTLQDKKKANSKPRRAVFDLFIKAVAPQQSKLGKIDKAITERIMTYLLMNLQSLCESMPSSIIQLVAISILLDVTDLQIISLCLSLFSLACKSFIVSRSFTIAAFLSKIFIMSFDLFSNAFVFSCLLATNTPRDTTFFFGIIPGAEDFKVNALSNVWVILKVFCVIIWIIIGISAWVRFFIKEVNQGEKCSFFFWSFLGFLCSCLMAGPVLIAEECMKISWFVWYNHMINPQTDEFPNAALLHSFLHGEGENSNNNNGNKKEKLTEMIDWAETWNFFQKKCVEDANRRDEIRAQKEKEWISQRKKEDEYDKNRPRNFFNRFGSANPYVKGSISIDHTAHSDPDTIFQQSQRVSSLNNNNNRIRQQQPSFYTRARHVLLTKKFLQASILSRVYPTHHLYIKLEKFGPGKLAYSYEVGDLVHRTTEVGFKEICKPKVDFRYCDFVSFAVGAMMAIEVVSTLYSLCFFFIYGIQYFNELAIMQRICFYVACASLFFAVCLSPSFWKYFQTCLFYKRHMPYETHETKTVMSIINSYFSVPLSVLQVACVPGDVIPDDCFAKHCLPFLTTKQVGLFGILAEDFQDLQKITVKTVKNQEDEEKEKAYARDAFYGTGGDGGGGDGRREDENGNVDEDNRYDGGESQPLLN